MSLNDYIKFKKELKNSKTHGFMHLPEEHKKEMFSFHRRGKQKTIWYRGNDWVTMESNNSRTNPEIVSYRCPTFPFHSLHEAVINTTTPKIRASEGYKIRFCENLFVNMIKNFYLYHNEIELQQGNTISLLEDLRDKDDWKVASKKLGNIKELTTFSYELPSMPISIMLPMTYSQSPSDAFPLVYCGQKDDLIHKIIFNLSFSSLILITDEEGNEVEFNKDLIEVDSDIMPVPELEGNCSFLNEKDSDLVNSFNNDSIEGDEEEEEEKEYYSTSLYYYEDTNPSELGKKVDLDFKVDDKHPVQKIFWGAKNVNASERTKNLTTEFDNKSPIKNTEKLSSSSGALLVNKSSYKTEFAYHKKKGYLGMNKWTNSVNYKEDGKKFIPGVALNGGSLVVNLEDKTSDDKFLLFAGLRYTKRFRFISYPKTFQERKDLRSTIIPDDED